MSEKIYTAADSLLVQQQETIRQQQSTIDMHEDKIGTRYPSSQMSNNYDGFEIGALNKLYTIKTKGGNDENFG